MTSSAIATGIWKCVDFMEELTLIISQHSRDRIVERLGCKKWKVTNMVRKAWLYGSEPSILYMKQRKHHENHKRAVYKVWMGGVFIFKAEEYGKLVLITVMKYELSNFVPLSKQPINIRIIHQGKNTPPALPH